MAGRRTSTCWTPSPSCPGTTAPSTGVTSSTASSTGRTRNSWARRGSSPGTARVARQFRSYSRRSPASSTTSVSSARCTRVTMVTRSRSDTSTGALPASRAGRRWGAGSSTAWAVRRRSCRPTWCSPIPAACRSTARSTGRADSCRRCIKGRCCGRRNRGSSTSTRRPTCAGACKRRTWRSWIGSTGGTWHSTRARPTSRPGSRATSWPRPCRRPRRRPWTSRTNPHRSGGCMGWTRMPRGNTARAA